MFGVLPPLQEQDRRVQLSLHWENLKKTAPLSGLMGLRGAVKLARGMGDKAWVMGSHQGFIPSPCVWGYCHIYCPGVSFPANSSSLLLPYFFTLLHLKLLLIMCQSLCWLCAVSVIAGVPWYLSLVLPCPLPRHWHGLPRKVVGNEVFSENFWNEISSNFQKMHGCVLFGDMV